MLLQFEQPLALSRTQSRPPREFVDNLCLSSSLTVAMLHRTWLIAGALSQRVEFASSVVAIATLPITDSA